MQSGYMEGVMEGAMDDNRELGSFRDILRSYIHYVWYGLRTLKVHHCLSFATIGSSDLVGDNKGI